jgi:hypothetical protein
MGMEDGVMKEKAIFLDTTRMYVDGSAEIDFADRRLKLRLKPEAKRPEFFSLATPIRLEGSFDNVELKGLGISILGSAISFVTSPFHVPFRRLFKGEIPADGVEACTVAWRESGKGAAQEQNSVGVPTSAPAAGSSTAKP